MVEVWFFYILSALGIWGFNTVVDKIVLTRHLNSFSYLVAYIPAKMAYLVAILLVIPINFNSSAFYLTFIAGMIGILGYYAYAFAMKREEASRIAALTSLYPLFVAVLAAVFINEIFSPIAYVGIALMIFGTALISYKRTKFYKFVPISVIAIAVLANAFWGTEQTMSKISLFSFNVWEFMAVYLMGNLFMTVPSFIIPHFRKNVVSELKGLDRNTVVLIAISTSVWFWGIVLFFYAASIGPITLVSTLSIVAPFVALLFTIIVTRLWPHLLKEEIDRKTVALKLLAVVLIFLGTYLIVV